MSISCNWKVTEQIKCDKCDFDTEFDETMVANKEANHKEQRAQSNDCDKCNLQTEMKIAWVSTSKRCIAKKSYMNVTVVSSSPTAKIPFPYT